MIISKLVLENIRSYKAQEIDFPEGSILLSGDIGSGKSSILLSIEFALFGFRRLDLSGTTLLRHGEKGGSVELHFSMGKKEIIIKRTLKRGVGGVKQDKGFLIVDGIKEDLMPVEIKSRIIELLGYPQELLSRSKESIYRYTVYTPQEAMKHIIFADTQERLDILRRVFGIDRYKRIKENNLIYSRELKSRIRFISGQVEDLPKMVEEKENAKKDNSEFSKTVKEQEKAFNSIKTDLEKRKATIEEYEKKEKELSRIKNERKILDLQSEQIHKAIAESEKQIQHIDEKIKKDKESLDSFKDLDEKKLESFIKEISIRIDESEKRRSEYLQKKAVMESEDRKASSLVESIVSLNDCPTCRQEVRDEHKISIRKETQKQIDTNKERHKKIDEMLVKVNKNLDILKKKKEDVHRKMVDIDRKKLISKAIEERKQESSRLKVLIEENRKKGESIASSKKELVIAIDNLSEELKGYQDIKEGFEKLSRSYQENLQSLSKSRQKLEDSQERIKIMDKRIEEKQRLKQTLDKNGSLLSLFENSMTPLVTLMEKQVMGAIHYEFNQVLSKWFNLLIDEDMLSIRIDEEFNPVIEQNGYETQVDNLSGGEKTAVALSYRLALNRVINDVISTIRTNDLLILDEPTDGFSNEELSKLNEVLHEISVKQLIIVSHDSQIEGFVDNHIRIQKQEHESVVVD